MLFPSGNQFKCHEEVLYLQPLIPPKCFDIAWGYLDGRFDYGACGVCTRRMRRYGSVWRVCAVRVLDEPSTGRDACMS